MATTWTPPVNYENRPVAILGGGVLGRRIGACWASAGYTVVIRDPSKEQGEAALAYIAETVVEYATKSTTGRTPGKAFAYTDLAETIKDAWIVFEAVPEKLKIKIDTFADLEALAPKDCILASNSSSYKSGEMLGELSESTRTRVLNTHYMMPPMNRIVELMTCGYTNKDLIEWLAERHRESGSSPYIAMKESTGFIFNRVWAAVKRECLTLLSEGVSTPEQLDKIWSEMFAGTGKPGPCQLMDAVGLDTVAFIEEHYIHERGLSSEKTVDYLKANYLDQGKLGNKSEKGGFYPPAPKIDAPKKDTTKDSKLIVLDIGLGAPLKGKSPTSFLSAGRILEVSTDGKTSRTLVDNLPLPDGIDVDKEANRMYWTNMGIPAANDGTVMSANLDGSDVKTIVPPGNINTPKQLVMDHQAKKLYFSDREGLRVFRCNTDGSELEVLIKNGDWQDKAVQTNLLNWCVGVYVAPKLGKFFWTQKGPSKSNKGRIFSASIDFPAGQTADNRDDVMVVLDGLPECIDLDIDEETNTLYWTDRGEVPFGNCLYRAKLDASGNLASKHEIIAQNFDEAIGVKVDAANNAIYATDLGGSVWRTNLDGSGKRRVYEEETASFTGLTLV